MEIKDQENDKLFMSPFLPNSATTSLTPIFLWRSNPVYVLLQPLPHFPTSRGA